MFTGFSILPLRFASLLGLVVACVGLVVALVFVVERARNPELPVGWASLGVSMLLLSGVQLFALGMLGEYLGRMFLEQGGQPQFIVREALNLEQPHSEQQSEHQLAYSGEVAAVSTVNVSPLHPEAVSDVREARA